MLVINLVTFFQKRSDYKLDIGRIEGKVFFFKCFIKNKKAAEQFIIDVYTDLNSYKVMENLNQVMID